MASTTLKYIALVSCITILGLFIYVSQYEHITSMIPTPTLQSYDDDNFYVDKYILRNGTLQLRGKYIENDTSVIQEKVVNIKGLSNLLNQIKPDILSDSKLERADLPEEKYFKVTRTAKDANCNAIFRNDKSEIERAINVSTNNPKKETLPKDYIQMASNCSRFIRERGYVMSPLTKEENDFPIAFSILLFTAVEQSERLLRAIYRPQNLYCIHVDQKSDSDIYDAVSTIAKCFDNVFLTPTRYTIQWGTISVLEPEVMCMKELWKRSKAWKYFINLTGQEFPLRTNYELVRILTEYNGANDMEGTVERANKDRWENAGPAPHKIVPTKGSVHIIASRGFVDFVLHDQRAIDFFEWTKKTSVPDETFFASLNHNPHLGVPGSYKGLPETDHKIKPFVSRFKNWGNGIYNWPCFGKRVRMICVFGTGDLPELSMRKEMFANKFYLDYHHFALDCMEELHFNHTRDEYLGKLTFDSRWYSKLGFVLNKVDS